MRPIMHYSIVLLATFFVVACLDSTVDAQVPQVSPERQAGLKRLIEKRKARRAARAIAWAEREKQYQRWLSQNSSPLNWGSWPRMDSGPTWYRFLDVQRQISEDVASRQ